MFGYKVQIESYCIHSERSDEEYGPWSSSYSNRFDCVAKTDKYPDISSSLDIAEGEDCLVVWAEWSSGDSFGSGDRNNTEAVAVFKDYSCAKLLKELLLKHNDGNSGHEFEHTFSDGQTIKLSWVPWSGYFETLNEIRVEKTFVQ